MADEYNLEFLVDLPPELRTEEEDEFVSSNTIINEGGHYDNLVYELDESYLKGLAQEVIEDFDRDESSRHDWKYRERHGIRLLGVSENVVDSANFEGASQITYPGLVEAVVQFQARAIAELWPPEGPVKVIPLSKINKEQDFQAYRVQNYMNYLYTEKIPAAFEEQDKMLFRLALSGSAFVKVCYDPLEETIVRKYVSTDDLVVPYEATDLRTTPRWTHVLRYFKNDLKRLMNNGFYKTLDGFRFSSDDRTGQDRVVQDEIDATESRDQVSSHQTDGPNIVYEQMRYLSLPTGRTMVSVSEEDLYGDDAVIEEEIVEEEDVALPYIVHVDKENQEVLAIYRAWEEEDPKRCPQQYVTHYKFLPGMGFYGYGYLHMLSSMAHAETGILRALIDAAQFSNLQGGFVSSDLKLGKDEKPIHPGEWRRVKTTSDELQNAFFPMPYKEPSSTLYQLLQFVDEVFRRTAGTTEVAVGDAPNNAPVGTTLALIEQSQRVQTAVHIRLHHAAKNEFKIVQKLIYRYFDRMEYGPDSYVSMVDADLTADDFDGRVDIVPVSDPNIISSAQRVAMAQAVLQLSEQAPELYEQREVHLQLLEAMRIPNIDAILPDRTNIPALDPLTENMNIMMNQPVKAYVDQDHDAHLQVLDAWFNSTDPETRRQTEASYYAHRAEHVSFKYQLEMMQAMGLEGMPEDLTPEEQQMITTLAAQAAQTMLRTKAQIEDPETAVEMFKAQQDANIKTQKTISEIRRKDEEAAARIKREDAITAAKLQDKVIEREVDLLRENASNELLEYANSGGQ